MTGGQKREGQLKFFHRIFLFPFYGEDPGTGQWKEDKRRWGIDEEKRDSDES